MWYISGMLAHIASAFCTPSVLLMINRRVGGTSLDAAATTAKAWQNTSAGLQQGPPRQYLEHVCPEEVVSGVVEGAVVLLDQAAGDLYAGEHMMSSFMTGGVLRLDMMVVQKLIDGLPDHISRMSR
jgi:hypothetical protein